MPTEIRTIHEDGRIEITDGLSLTLAGIIWPDHLEPGRRQAVRTALQDALKGARIHWKALAKPDRWGQTPALIFAQEAEGTLPPFLVQAGLLEVGLVPFWPEAALACKAELLAHEAEAVRTRRGHWAPRAQTERHRAITMAPERHAGRAIAALWRVHSVRKWRSLTFVNIAPSLRGGPSLALTGKQVSEMTKRGQNPQEWKNRRVIARVTAGPAGLSRLRLETVDYLDVLR